MVTEYIAKIKGDTSALEQAISKAEGKIKRLNDDEVLIKLNYDGNIAGFNKVFNNILKTTPELTINFQYETNKQILNNELDKLSQLENLKLDIDSNNVQSKINSMLKDIKEGFDLAIDSEEELYQKIQSLLKYANMAEGFGLKINTRSFDELERVAEEFESIDKLLDKNSRKPILPFKISGEIDSELEKTKNNVEDLQSQLLKLEKLGASTKIGDSSVDELKEKIKAVEAQIQDLSERINQNNSNSSHSFYNLSEEVDRLNKKLRETIDQVQVLNGSNNDGMRTLLAGLSEYSREHGGKHLSGYWEELKTRIDNGDNSLKKLISDLGLLDSATGSLKLVTDGLNNRGGIIGDSNVLLARDSDERGIANARLNRTKELKERLDEVADAGANVARILDLVYDSESKIFLEIQERAKGDILGHDSLDSTESFINPEFFRATADEVKKLISDLEILRKVGLGIDNNPGNFLYDEKNGFSLVDLSLTPAKDLEQNIGDLRELFTYVRAIAEETKDQVAEVKVDDFIAKFDEISNVVQETVAKTKVAMQDAQNSNSPSEESRSLGHDWGNGYIEGIRDKIAETESAAADLAAAAKRGLTKGNEENPAEYDNTEFINQLHRENAGTGGVPIAVRPVLDPYMFAEDVSNALDGVSASIDVRPVLNTSSDSFKDSADELQEAFRTSATLAKELKDALGGGDVLGNISGEIELIDRLETSLAALITTIEKKTNAFLQEGEVVKGVVDKENNLIDNLKYSIQALNSELQFKENSNSSVREFYETHGTPTMALDRGDFAQVEEVLKELGGRFAEMNAEAEDFSEQKLNAEFFKDLIQGLSLTEDKLTVVKAALLEIDNFVEGGKFRHLHGDQMSTEYVSKQLKLINGVINGDHIVSNEDITNANKLLNIIREANDSGISATAQGAEQEADKLEKAGKSAKNAAEEKEKFAEANKDVLKSIIESLKGLSEEGNAFDKLNKLIKTLSKQNDMTDTVVGLQQIAKVLNEGVNDNSLVKALQEIASEGENLKNLATVLKNVKKVPKAKKEVENENRPDESVLENYQRQAAILREINELKIKNAERKTSEIEEVNNQQKINELEQEQISLKEKLTQASAENAAEEKKLIELQEELNRNLKQGVADDMVESFKKLDGILAKSGWADEYKTKIQGLRQEILVLSSQRIDMDTESFINEWDRVSKAIDAAIGEQKFKESKAASETAIKRLMAQVEQITDPNISRSLKKKGEGLLDSLALARNADEVDKLKGSVADFKREVSESQKVAHGFFSTLRERLIGVNAQLIAQYLSWQDMIRYVRQAAQAVINVDSALTELRKVSGASTDRLQESFKASTETAKELGSTISDVISVTADWSRVGYSIGDAEKLARITTLFQTVGDNMTVETASQAMISTIKAYGMQVDEVESIVDKYNEVANNFAIDTAGISDAIERSGASLKAAGNDLNQSLGMIVAANNSIQNPSSVGQMLKTKFVLIYSNMNLEYI